MRTALEVQHQFFDTTLDASHFAGDRVTMGHQVGWRWSFLGVDMGSIPATLRLVLPWLPPIWSEVRSEPLTDFHGQQPVRHTLFTREDGTWICAIPAGWTCLVDGREVDAPEVEVTGELTLARGDEHFRARIVDAPPAPERATVEPDYPLLGTLATLGTAAALFGMATLFAPPRAEVGALVLDEHVAQIQLQTPPPAPKPPAPEKVVNQLTSGGGSGGPAKASTEAGGPKTDRQIAQSAGLFQSPDLLSDLGGGLGDLASVAAGLQGSPSGRGPALGSGLGGRDLGGGGGPEGIGDIGGPGGGPGSRLGYVGDGPGKRPGRIAGATTGEPILIGTLSRSEIDDVIQRNMQSIRYCYQRRLQANPELGGKLVVKFTIAADGSVSSSGIKSSSLGDPAVDRCVTGRFDRMRFPNPRGRGVVLVTYPFLFSPG